MKTREVKLILQQEKMKRNHSIHIYKIKCAISHRRIKLIYVLIFLKCAVCI